MGSALKTNNISARRHSRQGGVVLIVALLLLMVLTILASMSIRGASSSEQIANQDRLKTTAQQAAEAALRYCEGLVQTYTFDNTKNIPALGGLIPAAAPAGGVFNWEISAGQNFWDNAPGLIAPQIVPFASAGDGTGGRVRYFLRSPECIAQYTAAGNNKVFVTTARGFGPEVQMAPNPKNGTLPVGTEVWLQSVVTMN
jgi:type IV pilus assembly protein PilX